LNTPLPKRGDAASGQKLRKPCRSAGDEHRGSNRVVAGARDVSGQSRIAGAVDGKSTVEERNARVISKGQIGIVGLSVCAGKSHTVNSRIFRHWRVSVFPVGCRAPVVVGSVTRPNTISGEERSGCESKGKSANFHSIQGVLI